MQTVKIERVELLKRIKSNREEHHSMAIEAKIGYNEQAIKQFEEMIRLAKEEDTIQQCLNLSVPIDNTDDYDRVIDMLEMSTDGIIELSGHEFDQYVRDNWEWKQHAMLSNSKYMKH